MIPNRTGPEKIKRGTARSPPAVPFPALRPKDAFLQRIPWSLPISRGDPPEFPGHLQGNHHVPGKMEGPDPRRRQVLRRQP